jgi:uncharacterized protein (DUF2235 family)
MPKNIVFCADGTWNGPAEPDHDDKTATATNVFKLFLALAGADTADTALLANEQERILAGADGAALQHAKYLHGVGDSDNFLVQALGGTIGAGLIARIVRGYTFISRNYATDDKIFIVGFSRGAYTARALAGLIAAEGLLDATQLDLDDRQAAYRLGSAVWYAHLQAVRRTNTDWLARLQELVLDLPGFLARPPAASQLVNAPIEAVAVWDTVGALGIPQFTVKWARVDAFQFADYKLSTVVRRGFHAVAVDERRADFTPTLWDADPRIIQVLFPGAHADVGGGYPAAGSEPVPNENVLSDCALAWMIDRLAPLGMLFAAAPPYPPPPGRPGVAHQPWAHDPWTFLPRSARCFPAGLSLSQSLLDRLAAGPVVAEPGTQAAPYAPQNLGGYLDGGAAAPGIPTV